jgi:hypothetical protein
MKTIFYFVFFVFLSGCAMMEKSEPSERELTTIREIDKFSKKEMQNSITEWFATTYKDSRNVIKLNDRNAGTIVGTGSLSYVVGLGVTNARYNIKIDIKDGRYQQIGMGSYMLRHHLLQENQLSLSSKLSQS